MAILIGFVLATVGYWLQVTGYNAQFFHSPYLWWFPTVVVGGAILTVGWWMTAIGLAVIVIAIISFFFRGRDGMRGGATTGQPVVVEK